MKISELALLRQLDLDSSVPVAIAGQTMRITLRQLLDALSSNIILFDGVVTAEVPVLAGTTEAAGDVVYLVRQNRFAYRVATADGFVYYDTWVGVDRYMTGSGPLCTCLFIDRTSGLLYSYDAERGWLSVGLTAAQAEQLQLNTPIEVDSEETMEQMIAAGLCAEGQLYYIVEE